MQKTYLFEQRRRVPADEPCRADCPAGDCAGCAFPPPAPRARCVPYACPQVDRCERACMHPWDGVPDIDASVALVDGMCAIFLDTRGTALLARHA